MLSDDCLLGTSQRRETCSTLSQLRPLVLDPPGQSGETDNWTNPQQRTLSWICPISAPRLHSLWESLLEELVVSVCWVRGVHYNLDPPPRRVARVKCKKNLCSDGTTICDSPSWTVGHHVWRELKKQWQWPPVVCDFGETLREFQEQTCFFHSALWDLKI